MWTDKIVEKTHQVREAYAKSFNAESGREIVNLPRKSDQTACWSGRTIDT